MPRRSLNPSDLARLSGAMLEAMAEARALNESGEMGRQFRRCLQIARDNYDRLLAELITAEPGTAQYARGLADSMGNHLTELERLVEPPPSQREM
jgi:hypothetical protein